jgi:hypothetical protein
VRITPGLTRYGNISGGTNFPPAALAALANLQATQKKVVFPVYSTVAPPLFGVPSPANPNQVNVVNFVAGTVQSVTFVPDITLPTPPFPPGTVLFSQRVIIGIRPTMLESPTTLTDPTRRAAINGPDNNPYIAKVRLVK